MSGACGHTPANPHHHSLACTPQPNHLQAQQKTEADDCLTADVYPIRRNCANIVPAICIFFLVSARSFATYWREEHPRAALPLAMCTTSL